VGAGDIAVFKRQTEAIEAAATSNTAFTEDLNGDGVINDNECYFPKIDLNGSGAVTPYPRGLKRVAGSYRSDLQALSYAWTGAAETFQVALADAGITSAPPTEAIASASENSASLPAPAQCRGTVTAAVEPAAPSPAATQAPVPPPPPATVIVDGGKGPVSAAEGSESPPLTVVDTAPVRTAENIVAEPSAVRSEVQEAIEALKRENPKLRVTINPATGLPSSISGFTPRPDAPGAGVSRSLDGPSDEDVRRIVDGFFASGGLASTAPTARTFATRNRLAVTKMIGKAKKDPDFPDRTIATVQQQVDGVPVFGSTGKLTLDQLGGVSKYIGTASQVAIEDTKPKLTDAEAIEAARVKLRELIKGGRDLNPIPLPPNVATAAANASLTVFDPAIIDKKSKGATRLAYLVNIETFRLFVDAKSGEVFYYYRDQPSGMLRRIYDLGRSTVFPGTKVADEETHEIADTLNDDSMTAFRNGGVVRDYFFMLFGRDGYDDNDGPSGPRGGGALESYVRYGSLSNAYWCPAPSTVCPKANVMVYGPGYAEAIDIVGHEITHGIVAHEKNLLYLNESGAVNESLADIFGTLIEQYINVPRGNWVIGEKLPGFSEATPMRSLAEPNLKDREGHSMFHRDVRYSMSNRGQPDRYADLLTPLDPLCGKTRMQDNGCVHFNSGILNKMAYLISEGGEHYGVKVSGIGRIKLARLAYRTMTAQLNESSGLVEAADGFMLSCLELAEAGKGGITSEDCDQVGAAQSAVGLVQNNS
jgi:Zn-dependent metalloprotease